MAGIGYIKMEEVGGIPRLPETPGVVIYAPLGNIPVDPDAVIFAGQPRSIMLVQEAAVRAGTVTQAVAAAWTRAGVSRISLGVQSFMQRELARTGRKHTAEVVAVAEGVGEINRKGVKRDIRDSGSYATTMGGNANNPVLNEAMDKAIVQLGTQVDQTAPKIPTHVPLIEGLVADANEAGRLVLNVGSRGGVKVGDRLQVWRIGKEIRDPATGKLLLRDDTLLGEAVVKSVSEGFSIAAYQGTEPVKTGDAVKSAPKPQGGG
jgi:hypothetical protein